MVKVKDIRQCQNCGQDIIFLYTKKHKGIPAVPVAKKISDCNDDRFVINSIDHRCHKAIKFKGYEDKLNDGYWYESHLDVCPVVVEGLEKQRIRLEEDKKRLESERASEVREEPPLPEEEFVEIDFDI